MSKKGSRGKGRLVYSAFNYKEGGKIAFVNHYNIRNASLSKRQKVATGLKQRGIRSILTGKRYQRVDKFLKLVA